MPFGFALFGMLEFNLFDGAPKSLRLRHNEMLSLLKQICVLSRSAPRALAAEDFHAESARKIPAHVGFRVVGGAIIRARPFCSCDDEPTRFENRLHFLI